MAVMHTPDTTGLVAVYGSANGYPNFERDVLGWDKLGRPLVMCGDALHVAQTAPFEKYPKFGWLKKPDMVSAFQQEIYNHLQNTPDITEAVAEAVSEAVRAELKSRRPQKPLPEVGVGILEEHMGVPLLIHIREANPRMSSYGNSVTGTPLVDYLAWNPFSDETSRHDDVMIAQPRVAAELVQYSRTGGSLILGVFVRNAVDHLPQLAALRNSEAYTEEQARERLTTAATDAGWVTLPGTDA
ncbi:hypothetical protein [Mycolicibacterium mageritense]|jgi:hypothetical protein|uniref:Thymidine phosphorylase n=2 Tax=Mycolicibacterium canariasense TaxID=228230 RepID=A0A100WCG5_MYCCR|nr:hypothetical protein [Mycolicibacterium mageritense]MCC9184558.1 hypothetical protein [Mycolicibacterium mageritense]ORV09757.1 hypothetical protein AWB94_08615 [Mycolicibacterium canariasense]GAS95696.1 Thymidine phosphorylase [Mycolicibacterium canariasense]